MFKKILSIIVSAIILVSIFNVTAMAQTQNNIFELWGDFENTQYADKILHKVRFNRTEAKATIVDIGADGSAHSLKLDTSMTNSSVCWLNVPQTPGETYDLSMKIKTDTPDVTSFVVMSIYDETVYVTVKQDYFNSNNGWKEYKVTFTAPTEYNGTKLDRGTRFQIETRGSATGGSVLYIDNLSMIPHGNVKHTDHSLANAGIVSYEEGDGIEVTKPAASTSGDAVNIYVDAKTGNDSYDGSESSPLASIEAARDLAKEYAPEMKNNIYIKIRGEQYLEETFKLDETNSGQNGYKIIYTSWGDEQATLTMAKKFTGFTLHDSEKNIWKINVGKDVYSRTAYFNDTLGIRARMVGYLKNVDYVYQSHFLCDNTELLDLAYPAEIELVHHMLWYNVVYQAKSISSENNRVRIDMHDSFYHDGNRIDYYDRATNKRRQTPSYLENAYEFLDRSGEWYLNKHEGYLYYIPRQGEVMETMELKLPLGEEIIKVAGSNLANPVCHVGFDNLKIEGTTWLRVEKTGSAEFLQNNKLSNTSTRLTPEGFVDKTSVYFYACRYIDITNCDFRHLGSAGASVLFYEGAKHINVIGNEFYELGGAGLEFDYPRNSTPYNRSASSLCEYITVENNYFHDIALDFSGGAALSLGHPRHVKVRYNEIANTNYSGIHVGWGWAQLEETGTPMYDVEISYNYIHDVMVERVNDGAHIYTLGPSSYECDTTADALNNGANKNRIINNNLVNGWNCSQVYPDNGSTSWYIANNVCDTGYVDEIEYNYDEGQIPLEDYYWMHLHIDTIKWITTENNYSQADYAYVKDQMNQQESSIEPTKMISGELPEAAKKIVNGAGIRSEYRDNFDLTGPKTLATGDRWMSLELNTPTDSELMVLGDYNTKYDLSDYEIEWWIDDPEAVTIDENGMLTAHKKGTYEAEAFVFLNGLWQSKHFLLVCGEEVDEEILNDKYSSLNDYAMSFENGASTAIYTNSWKNATTSEQSNGNETIQLTKDPLNKNNTVLKLTLASSFNGGSTNIRLSKTTSKWSAGAATGTIPAGGSITYSFRYYLPQEMESKFTYNGKEYVPGFCIVNPTNKTTKFAISSESLATSSGKWHKATLTYTNNTNAEQPIDYATLRCSGDNLDGMEKFKNWIVAGHSGYNPETATADYGERTIYFDDFRVTVTGKHSSLDGYSMDFENGSSIAMYADKYYNLTENKLAYTNGSNVVTSQLITDPADSSNTVAKLTLSSSAHGSHSNLRFSNTTQTGINAPASTVKLPAGARMVYTFRYYLPQEVNKTNTFGNSVYAPEFCIVSALEDGTIAFASPSAHLETEAQKWHTAVLTYINNSGSSQFIEYATLRCEGENSSGTSKYTQWTIPGNPGYNSSANTYTLGERTIYFDDFNAYIDTPPAKERFSSLDSYRMGFEYGSSMAIYTGKYTNVSTIEKSNSKETVQITKDPENSINTVMKLTLTSDARGTDSTMRFAKTRTVNAEVVPATVTIPAGYKLVYSFRYYFPHEMNSENTYENTSYKPSFCILNPVGGTPKFAVSSEPLETSANIWHTATLSYENGTDRAQTIDYADLRYEGDNLSGKGNYTNWVAQGHSGYNPHTGSYDLGERVIYFDDFTTHLEKAPEPLRISSLNDYIMNFERGASLAMYTTQWTSADITPQSTANGSDTIQLVSDPENSENTVVKVSLLSDAKGLGLTFRNIVGSGGKNLAEGTLPAGHTITYTFRYRFAQEMNPSNGEYNGTTYYPAFCIANSTKNSGVKFSTSDTLLACNANKWHTATLTYTNDTGSAVDITQAGLRYCGDNANGKEKYQYWTAAGHSGYNVQSDTFDLGERVIYFDDFNVTVQAPQITDTTLEKVSGGIKVSADKTISSAKLIFVKYTSGGKMSVLNTDTSVTLNAQGTRIYTIPAGFENAKVMLIKDLKTFIPLASAIQY